MEHDSFKIALLCLEKTFLVILRMQRLNALRFRRCQEERFIFTTTPRDAISEMVKYFEGIPWISRHAPTEPIAEDFYHPSFPSPCCWERGGQNANGYKQNETVVCRNSK